MPTIEIQFDGKKLVGATEKDQRSYAKFRTRLETMGPKESLIFSWKEPRSGPYHRRHFAILNAIFASQDNFTDETQFRKWLEVGAGYADILPGPKGKPVAIARSIAYENLDQADFEPIHQGVMAFARSIYATQYLWPHINIQQQADMIESILMGFE